MSRGVNGTNDANPSRRGLRSWRFRDPDWDASGVMTHVGGPPKVSTGSSASVSHHHERDVTRCRTVVDVWVMF